MAMVLGKTVLLSVLIAHVLAAPKPCVDSCNSYGSQTYEQQSSSYKHVQQGGRLGSQNILDIGYNRPGNWTEHNQFITDGGHGQVHEERGQYVQGPSQVKYYKKNYTSSYSSGNGGGSMILDKLSNYDMSIHDRLLHEQQTRLAEQMRQLQTQGIRHNEHLEDFTEHREQTQTTQHDTTGIGSSGVLIPTGSVNPMNMYYNSYYRNYSAIFSNYGVPMPMEMQRIQSQVEVLRDQLRRQQEQLQSSTHVSSSITSVNSQSTVARMQSLKTEMERCFQEFLNSRGVTNTQDVQIAETSHTPQRTYDHTFEKTHEHINMDQNYNRQQVEQRPQNQVYGRQYHQEYEQQYRVGVLQPTMTTSIRHEEMNADQTQRNQQYVTGVGSLNMAQSERQQEMLYRERMHNTQGQVLGNSRVSGRIQDVGTVYASDCIDCHRPNIHDRQMESYERSAGSSMHESYRTTHAHNTQVGQSSQITRHGSTSGQYVTGVRDPCQMNTNCYSTGSSEYNLRHTRLYKREAKPNMHQRAKQVVRSFDQSQQKQELTQQIGDSDELYQQTSGKLEYGQQTQQHSGHLTQQTEDLTQQTGDFDDFTQQTSGHLELGQHTQQPSGHLTQQTEDLTQQTGGFGDYTQQTSGHLELGQHTQQPSGHLSQQTEDLTQQTGGFGDYTQQTSGHLELGQHTQQPTGHLSQQTEDLTQQSGEFGDYTQQTSGHLELGQHTQQPSGHLSQQTEDLTQQTGGFGDYTQQTSGNLEYGQQTQQHSGHLTQQTEDLTQQTGGFGDYTQQTSGKLEFGQQTQQPYGRRHAETTGHLEFGQQSQQPHRHNNLEIGSQQGGQWPQQTGKYGDFSQQTSGGLEFGQQGQQSGRHTQQTQDIYQQSSGHLEFGQHTQETEDLTQQSGTGFNDFSQQTLGQREYGQQPPYPYDNRMPQVGNQQGQGQTQQTEDFTRYQQNRPVIPAPKPTPRSRHQRPGRYELDEPETGDTNIATIREPFEVKAEADIDNGANEHQSGQMTQITSDYNNQDTVPTPTSGYSGVKGGRRNRPNSNRRYSDSLTGQINNEMQGNQHQLDRRTSYPNYQNENQQAQMNVPSSQTEPKVEPRILEVYSLGPYNASHSDDIFDKVTPHPSATLPPYDGSDPWDIREKPREMRPSIHVVQTTPPPPETIQTTTEIPVPSTTTFWGKIGHKISNTYDKAKEKAKDLFG